MSAHPLTRRECETLLRGGERGRIAVSTPQGPHIVPVRYVVVEDEQGPAVVARVGTYSLLGTYADGAMLAFEVDGSAGEPAAPWSVVARGRGELLRRPPGAVGRLDGDGWTAGPRSLYLRLRPAELAGSTLDAVA